MLRSLHECKHMPMAIALVITMLGCPGIVRAQADIPFPPAFTLHSDEPYHAVHVPFRLESAGIVLKIETASATGECLLDTGNDSINWPDRLNLPSKATGWKARMIDGAGRPREVELRLLPMLRIGGYEVRDVPGYPIKSASANNSILDRVPVLGNAAFAGIVLTIDWQKGELILRSPEYDFTREPRQPGDRVLTFVSLYSDASHGYGKPLLPAIMDGQNLRMALDTGWGGEAIGLSAATWDTARRNGDSQTPQKHELTFANGPVEVDWLPHVSFSLGGDGTPIQVPAAVLPPGAAALDVDALIGPAVLKNFRITVDYPRRKIRMEPYSGLKQ